MHCVQSRTLAHCAAGTQGPQQEPTMEGTRPRSQVGGSAAQVTVPEQLMLALHRSVMQSTLAAVTPSALH